MSSLTGCSSYGFTELAGVCYLPVDARLPWNDARHHCINMGADLIQFSSTSQFDAIHAVIMQLGNFM